MQLDAKDDDEEKIDDTLAQSDKSEDKKGSADEKKVEASDKKSKDKKAAKPAEEGFKFTGSFVNDGKPTILQTGATHARELISTNLNVYQMLKLIKKGEIEKTEEWKKLLEQNKYIFMPIYNVDGVNFIEEHWNSDHKIMPKRKNMNLGESSSSPIDGGVDLNRQF